MDDLTGNLFPLFCSTLARGVENICEIFSDFENVSQKLFTKKKNGETRIKRALDYLRIPKLQGIFKSSVCHRYGRLAVLQNVFAIILHGAKNFEKLFEETEYK